MENTSQKELAYFYEEPEVKELQKAYNDTVTELHTYLDMCKDSFDDRRNYWPGKTRDLRKHGADAFPWDGASDMEAHTIDERISKLSSMLMVALKKANVRAMPTNATQTARAQQVSALLKWMISSGYLPRFYEESELGANYLLERGLLITYIGYHQEDRRYLQTITVDQINQVAPEIVQLLMEGNSDPDLADLLMSTYDGVTEKRAKKAIQELRNNGETELPIIKREVDAPVARTLAPDSDWFFPPYVTDPQRSPFGFYKTYYTIQELKGKIITDGWDEDVVEELISKCAGVNIYEIEGNEERNRSNKYSNQTHTADELIEIIHVFQRLVDPDDGCEGIYETIIHKSFSGNEAAGIKGYLKRQLLNGYEDYPVEVTKLTDATKRLYDTGTISSQLRGIQNQIKVERDSRIDRNSMSTLPPLLHPVGNKPGDWGPGRKIPYRRKGEFEYGPAPDFDPGSVEIETTLIKQADALVGLDFDNPISQFQREHLINKFLGHYAKVLCKVFKCYQRFGPDKVFFRVTGNPNPQEFTKGDPDENYNVSISYDILNSDPETFEKKAQQYIMLMQMDKSGIINSDRFIEWAANSIDPAMADMLLQPIEEAREKIIKDVTDDLAKIFAGIEMPARPNGAQIALQAIQQYVSQPDIQQRAAQDEAFRARLEKYQGQYIFQQQQIQNAQIGKIGTAPAQMGGMNTQNIEQ